MSLKPSRIAPSLLLFVAAIFYALHFLHLNADFPNFSPWMDWSKYTDEGWYGDAAIRQVISGHWFYPGDFNPAVALPVWPFVEFLLFRVTGVSAAAARALTVVVFGLILAAAYLLLRNTRPNPAAQSSRPLAPAVAVLLLSVNPFCYAFTRMAITEPMLILFTLLALLTARKAAHTTRRNPANWAATVLLGLLFVLMVLTKTTAIFLLPAVIWQLWADCGYRLRPFLRVAFPAAACALLLWSAYFFLLVRPHYLEDYRYLFNANGYTGITRQNFLSVLADTFHDGMWLGRLFYPLGLAAFLLALTAARRLWRNPLVPTLSLWVAGYLAFLAYHDNLQPRYYLVVAVPMTMLVALAFEELFHVNRLLATLAAAALLLLVATDASQTLHFLRTPQYTLQEAALGVRRVIDADPSRPRLLLSISGSDITLLTGVPSICDDFGTDDLSVRVAAYRPGWYAAWNDVEDDKMEALNHLYSLERVAEFPAMDDPERNLLILYRLDPAAAAPPQPHRTKPIPKRLQTRSGQQPSTNQLQH